MNDYTSNTRLIAKIARDVAAGQIFASYTDLKDALRRRLLQLKIRCQQHEFDDAVSLVTSNTGLWVTERQIAVLCLTKTPAIFTRPEAKRLYDDLWRRYRIEHPQPAVPPTPERFAYFALVPVARW